MLASRPLAWESSLEPRRCHPGPHGQGALQPSNPRPQRLASWRSDLRQRVRGIMTAESSLLRRGPRGRGRTEGDEEAAAILDHLEYGDEAEAEAAPESGASGASAANAAGERGPGAGGARRVHLAVLPERYEPLEEPAPGEKPRRRYRRKLKKYGKVGALRRHCPGGAGAPGPDGRLTQFLRAAPATPFSPTPTPSPKGSREFRVVIET
ncbi:hypothetical protein P7K49_036053 [Saguinus oedipus]|uniref:Uncharacterized protein n=1 Tax=Saguinus oedipus TaxID=9490 RepID=A0ABQ9TPE1_SAGOE|nr:hypothetical protein P7K49_036053 [Saguinus oedipus]